MPARRLRFVAVVVALVPALVGCGVRLETPAPTAPAPDAVEQVRARTVDDALALVEAATSAHDATDATDQATAAGVDPVTLTAVLDDIVTFSTQHATELGGVYDSGLPDPSGSPTGPTPGTATSPAAAVTPVEVLALLARSAATALDDAGATKDGSLARLVASVGTARTGLAQRLSQVTGTPVPEQLPEPDPAGTPTATSSPAPSAGTTPTDEASGGDPSGLASSDLDTLVLAEDQAGYAFEVVAAVLSGDQRTQAQAAAATHRQVAEEWATLAGTTGTTSDPRRVAYAVPVGVDDPTVALGLARTVLTTLADTYATLTARAEAGTRGSLLDGLTTGTADAVTWGATAVAFPGMPELAPAAG